MREQKRRKKEKKSNSKVEKMKAPIVITKNRVLAKQIINQTKELFYNRK